MLSFNFIDVVAYGNTMTTDARMLNRVGKFYLFHPFRLSLVPAAPSLQEGRREGWREGGIEGEKAGRKQEAGGKGEYIATH